MRTKVLLAVLCLFMVGSLGVVIARIHLVPFFVNKGESVSGLNTKLYYFQPIYLWGYEKNGGVFAKVFYFRKSWIPTVGTLWLAGKYNGVEIAPVKDLNKKFRMGSRISTMYITGEKEAGLGVDPNNNTCEVLPRICQINDYLQDKPEIFIKFVNKEVLPVNQFLPVVTINSEIILK